LSEKVWRERYKAGGRESNTETIPLSLQRKVEESGGSFRSGTRAAWKKRFNRKNPLNQLSSAKKGRERIRIEEHRQRLDACLQGVDNPGGKNRGGQGAGRYGTRTSICRGGWLGTVLGTERVRARGAQCQRRGVPMSSQSSPWKTGKKKNPERGEKLPQ